jgi:hypothetical protein
MRVLPAVAFIALTMVVLPVVGQECERSDSAVQCLNKFNPPVAGDTDATPAAAEAATEAATETAVTGITNTASPAESSLKDFLSLLAASLESATSAQDGQAFTFDWNPPLAFTEKWGAKLQASFAETNLNDEVTSRLAANAAEIEKLKDSLEFGDDTTISGFIEPTTARSGRSIEPLRPWFRPMRDAVLAPRRQETADLRALLTKHRMLPPQAFENDANGQPLNDEAEVASRIADFEALGKRLQEARALRSSFFLAFAKLLNNQPQLYGAAIYHARRNVIGPNEWSGKFTYELAGNNLNAFRKKHPECVTFASPQAAADCAGALEDFASAMHTGIERIALSLEYHKVNRRWINDPDAGLDFGFPRTRSFVGSLAFGTTTSPILPFHADPTGVGDARLDFTAKYELPEDDESDDKGFVGTLTYTQRVSETFSLPLSLVYSDHESDLLNVQKRFSARLGLMYKLPNLTGPK